MITIEQIKASAIKTDNLEARTKDPLDRGRKAVVYPFGIVFKEKLESENMPFQNIRWHGMVNGKRICFVSDRQMDDWVHKYIHQNHPSTDDWECRTYAMEALKYYSDKVPEAFVCRDELAVSLISALVRCSDDPYKLAVRAIFQIQKDLSNGESKV